LAVVAVEAVAVRHVQVPPFQVQQVVLEVLVPAEAVLEVLEEMLEPKQMVRLI
jgi:hypothetical protein